MNVDAFPGLVFLDTNILVYSFDASAPAKQQIAADLLTSSLRSQRGVISSQVVQEFLNVALRKFSHPITVSEAREYLRIVLNPLCRHMPSIRSYDQALLLREEVGLAFYDALIVAAALEMGCDILLTEDMQTGRKIHGMKIVNPFAV